MPDDEMKINVNFPVGGSTLAQCLVLNEEIATITHSSIRFGALGNSKPHVTLLMGNVMAAELPSVTRIVRQYASQLPGVIDADFSRPYRETLTGRYIMADVTTPMEVMEWRLSLRQAIDDYFVSEARMSEELHVTLAVLDEPSTIADGYLADLEPLPASSFSSLDISEAGPKGAKVDVLAEVMLRDG